MSRVAKKPIIIPANVEISLTGQTVKVKGPKGQLEEVIHDLLSLEIRDKEVLVISNNKTDVASKTRIAVNPDALAGTIRANVNNMVIGVSQGWERKLLLVGVGYRAQVQGKTLNLSLGFSHPTNFAIPDGITIETPTQTEIIVKGVNKILVGQVSADIRAKRPVEPYKGKGIRYHDEHVIRKETKKK